MAEMAFDVFREIVSTLLTKTLGGLLGFASGTERISTVEDFDLASMVMEGIHDATRVKKRGYTPTTSMGRFTRELYAIVKFSNILVQKERRVLNLEDVPKIIRTKLYSSLK